MQTQFPVKSEIILKLPNLEEPISTRSALKRKLNEFDLARENDQPAQTQHQQLQQALKYNIAFPVGMPIPYPFLDIALTVKDIKPIACKIQELLTKIEIRPNSIVPLPKLQVSAFPDETRFKMNDEDNSYRILCRPWILDFILHVKNRLQFKTGCPIALTGVQGVGKSHALYLLVAFLRKESDKYRVFYLPSCSYLKASISSKDLGREDIVKELLVSFFDQDDHVLKTIINFKIGKCELDYCLTALSSYYYKNNIKIIVVLDQYNEIGNVDPPGPVKSLVYFISTKLLTVISYSANNNVPIKEARYDVCIAKDFEIKDEEMIPFCNLHTIIGDDGISEDDVYGIVEVTGRVPLEIVTCLKFDGDAREKISRYQSIRKSEFKASVRKYFDELKDVDVESSVITMLGLILGRSRPDEKYENFDKKIVIERLEIGFKYCYSFVNQLARSAAWDVIERRYKNKVFENIDSITRQILKSDRNQSQKGHEVERYIGLKTQLLTKFAVRPFNIYLEPMKIVKFTPETLQDLIISGNENAFFIPLIENLAGFDFIAYDCSKNEVFLIQATVESNSSSHRSKVAIDINNPDSKLHFWLTCLKQLFSKLNPTYYELYITADESYCGDAYNAVKISDICEFYPALDSYKK